MYFLIVDFVNFVYFGFVFFVVKDQVECQVVVGICGYDLCFLEKDFVVVGWFVMFIDLLFDVVKGVGELYVDGMCWDWCLFLVYV